MQVYEIIRKNITDRGIKQKFVAEQIGVPPELFRRSIEGKRKIPADEFVAICTVLSLQLSDFQNVTQ